MRYIAVYISLVMLQAPEAVAAAALRAAQQAAPAPVAAAVVTAQVRQQLGGRRPWDRPVQRPAGSLAAHSRGSGNRGSPLRWHSQDIARRSPGSRLRCCSRRRRSVPAAAGIRIHRHIR